MYFMRSIVVNPQRIPVWLRANLRNIRFEETISDWGAFFTHNLQPEIGYLSDIESVDDDQVKKLMRVSEHTGKRKGRKQPTLAIQQVESPDFPIGAHPTWEQIESILSTKPRLFLKPWTYDVGWRICNNAKNLFVLFTREVWYGLNDCFLQVMHL